MPPIELTKKATTSLVLPDIDLNVAKPQEVPQEHRIDMDALRRNVKLFIATPMYGGQNYGLYMKSCINLQIMLAQYGIECRFSFLFNESLIPRARNYLADEFIRSGYTHMLFLDSDIEFDPTNVIELLALDKDIAGAPYPKKSLKWENVKQAVLNNPAIETADLERVIGDYVFNPVPGTEKFNVYEPLDVLEIGTGYMMIKKEVFEKYKAHYPEFEYRPDHAGQSNFDGSRMIHAYFHCDIDPKSKRYLSEDYWFCVSSSCKVDTEHGKMTIGSMVRSKYDGKVKTLMSDGSFGFRKVTGWSKRKNNGKQWVKINTENKNNRFAKLTCTEDHRVAVINDVMAPSVSWVEAKDTVDRYSVRDTQQNENALYGPSSLSVLMGTLMGDASISKVGQLSMVHSIKQHDYHEYKNDLLCGTGVKLTKKSALSFSPSALTEMSTYPVNAQTKHLRKFLYVDGKKTVANIIPHINELALAFWYMDDGSINKNCAYMATYGFSMEDNLLLIDMFKKKWGFTAKLNKKTTKYKGEIREYYGLRFNTDDSKKFFELIERHVHPTMHYKLPESMRCEYNTLLPMEADILGYSVSKVTEIVPVKRQSMLYDIEVEDTHNFVGQGAVIHNCQMWRNMGGHIYLCPWMKTKHVGTYQFTGDLPAVAGLLGRL